MGGSGDLILREEVLPGVARLCFNRPDKLNALSLPMLRLFESHLDEIAVDAAVRVVILEGAGGRAFVAGADIEVFLGLREYDFLAFLLVWVIFLL